MNEKSSRYLENQCQEGSSADELTSVISVEHVKNILRSIIWYLKVTKDQIGLLFRAGNV